MSGSPSTNGGANGGDGNRGPGGKFAKGNAGGPGNPHAGDVGKLRAKFFQSIRLKDVEQALKTIRAVMKDGLKDGDRLAAAKELLDRVIGKAVATDLLERIENLERTIGERKDRT